MSSFASRIAWSFFVATAILVAQAGCGGPAPAPSGAIRFNRTRPPPKPGESITHSMMCSCIRCDPVRCCRELEQEVDKPDDKCADGYDFSKCGMAVSSCESRCFEHRWRVHVDKGCAAQPRDCCDA